MPTFSQLQSRVSDYLTDLPTETAALIPHWINAAQRRAEDRHNFRFAEASVSFLTIDGTRVLGAVPVDWKEARGKPWLLDGPGSGEGATTLEFEWAANESETIRIFNDDVDLDRGAPKMLRQTETEFHVYPYPDSNSLWPDGDYRVRVPYWKRLADMSLGTAENWFTTNAEDYLVFYAVGEGLIFNRDEQRAAVYVGKAEAELKALVRRSKLSRMTTSTLGLYRDANATRFQRRSY